MTQKLYKKHVKESKIQGRNYIQANVEVALSKQIITKTSVFEANFGEKQRFASLKFSKISNLATNMKLSSVDSTYLHYTSIAHLTLPTLCTCLRCLGSTYYIDKISQFPAELLITFSFSKRGQYMEKV